MVAVCNYTLSNSGVYCLSLYNLLIKTTCCDFTNKRSSNALKNRKSWMNINTLSINNFQQNASLQSYNQTGTINKLAPVFQLIWLISISLNAEYNIIVWEAYFEFDVYWLPLKTHYSIYAMVIRVLVFHICRLQLIAIMKTCIQNHYSILRINV